MKKSKIILGMSVLFISAGISLSAQNNTTAAGGDATGSGGSVSYSIGQIDYIVQTGSGGDASQGVQQPYEILTTGGLTETAIQLEAIAFPNPTTSGVMISVKETDLSLLNYSLFTAEGKLLEKKNITSQQTAVDLKSFANGNYFISIMKNNKQVKQFKIIKNQ